MSVTVCAQTRSDACHPHAVNGAESPSTAPQLRLMTDPLTELLHDLPELQGLKPAGDQKELREVLRKVGESQESLLRNLPDISAEEQVTREELNKTDSSSKKHIMANYGYLILPHLTVDGLSIDEHRIPEGKELDTNGIENGLAVTQGFATMPQHFHPSCQFESDFRYLGRQSLNGRETYVVAFAQRRKEARFTAQVTHLGVSTKVYVQGVAWIEPMSFQIVRMRIDLLDPHPEVRLERLTTEIEFDDVRLRQVPVALWLPSRVVVTTISNGKTLRNRHYYSSFKRFGSESRVLWANPTDLMAPR